MDSNAKSVLWGAPSNDDRGIKLMTVISKWNSLIVNDQSDIPTFSSTRGESFVDVVLVSDNMDKLVSNCLVMYEYTTSDHALIYYKFGMSSYDYGEDFFSFQKYSKVNWYKFRKILERLLRPSTGAWVTNKRDVILYCDHIHNSLYKTMKIMFSGSSQGRLKPSWWNDELELLRAKVCRLRRWYQRKKDLLVKDNIL
ncbi:uncharacterized protein LOC111615145 [Centruroides sculpturatus]|uniref:uncharacterized protein LOC111615145 n=1 Tax=Centruroides sculpturatus TaxID=218467 RepID=UPI000C6EC0D9|nr:uncharacterized protein LOC111615145 [Centruroides sculpturatus]